MSDSTVRYERTGSAAVVTIDRPERRNAVDGPTAQALREALGKFESDDDARVMILTGAGDVAFCAGADLKSIATLEPDHPEGPMGFTRVVPQKPAIAASRAGAWRAASSLRCGATCASPRRARLSASSSAAGECR